MTTLRGPWWARPGCRYTLHGAPRGPLRIALRGGKSMPVTYADLEKHAEGREVAAVCCESNVFATVLVGGAQMPQSLRLYTRVSLLVRVWPDDALEFWPAKSGEVALSVLVPGYLGG
jgi:hypothetical protein